MSDAHIISSDLEEITQIQATLVETGLFEEVSYSTTLGDYRRLRKRDSSVKIILVSTRLEGFTWIEGVKEVHHEDALSPVVLITDDQESITVNDAMTAGLSEVVSANPSLEEYVAKLERVISRLNTLNRRLEPTEMKTETAGHLEVFFGAKGGVGTSLHATLFARFWAAHVRTCLVDLDLYKGDLAAYCAALPRRSIVDLAEISEELSGRSIAEVAHKLECGIDLIAAPKDVEQVENIDERDLQLILSALRFNYDLVVVDCGSRLWDLVAVAIETADEVTLVTSPELAAVRNVRNTLNDFERLELSLGSVAPRLLFNRATKKAEIQPELGSKMTGLNTVSVTNESGNIETYLNTSNLLEAKTSGWDSIYRGMWESQRILTELSSRRERRKQTKLAKNPQEVKEDGANKSHGRRALKKFGTKEKEKKQ